MTNIHRAIAALNECAAAYEALPDALKTKSLFGPLISAQHLRLEAEKLSEIVAAMAVAQQEQ